MEKDARPAMLIALHGTRVGRMIKENIKDGVATEPIFPVFCTLKSWAIGG